jgi:hypothetical protein
MLHGSGCGNKIGYSEESQTLAKTSAQAIGWIVNLECGRAWFWRNLC